jgi:RNA polymerase sigma-70 factor (ECF subfamily)
VSDLATVPGSVSAADAARFEVVRPRLFGIAYSVLGGAAEAEDVVQDTWIRWHRTNRREVRDATAFLATATTRLAITVSQSARARHEVPSGAWMPEPIDHASDPTVGVERDEALEPAVRSLWEKLSPVERAVFVLREGFDYAYREIAERLELSEVNARQILLRARARLGGERRRDVSRGEHRPLLMAFTAASQTGEVAQLEQLLADDVVASGRLAVAA